MKIYFEGTNSFYASQTNAGISCSAATTTSPTSPPSPTLEIHFYAKSNRIRHILVAKSILGPGIGTLGICTSLIFHSGTIKANGGTSNPGIGASSSGIIDLIEFEPTSLNNINLETFGGTNGAGIGTGLGETPNKAYIKSISIKGGFINVTGGNNSAAIGVGYGKVENSCRIDSITISGGEISAWALWGAGIGCGYGHLQYSSTIGEIIITNSKIIAFSLNYGAGIGGGYGYNTNASSIYLISIKDSDITATSYNGAGIGGGVGTGINNCFVDIIILDNSEIHASSTYGAGIGGGLSDIENHDSGYVNEIRILSGEIYASSDYSCGIGGCYTSVYNNGFVKKILIQSGQIFAYGGVGFSAIGNAQEIIISSGITKFLAASLTQYVIGCSFKNTYPEPYNFNCLSLNIFGKDLEPNIIDLENVEFPSTVISENPFKCVNKHQQYRRTCGLNVEYLSLTFSASFDLSRFINIQSYLLILFSHDFVVL